MGKRKGFFNELLIDLLDLEDQLTARQANATESVEVEVGSGGAFATINEALTFLTEIYGGVTYQNPAVSATITLLTGFAMAEQVAVYYQDLSWITITSDDAEVSITRSALTTAYGGAYPAFYGEAAFLPRINVLFNMDTSGTATNRHGVMLNSYAIAIVISGKGVKNAGGHGLQCNNNCVVIATTTNFSGAGIHGMAFSSASFGRITGANLANAAAYGLYNAGSKVYADSCTITGAGNSNVFADAGGESIVTSSTCTGGTSYGIRAQNGGKIVAVSVNAQKGGSPASSDISVANGAEIVATSSTGGLSQTENTLTANGIIFK